MMTMESGFISIYREYPYNLENIRTVLLDFDFSESNHLKLIMMLDF